MSRSATLLGVRVELGRVRGAPAPRVIFDEPQRGLGLELRDQDGLLFGLWVTLTGRHPRPGPHPGPDLVGLSGNHHDHVHVSR